MHGQRVGAFDHSLFPLHLSLLELPLRSVDLFPLLNDLLANVEEMGPQRVHSGVVLFPQLSAAHGAVNPKDSPHGTCVYIPPPFTIQLVQQLHSLCGALPLLSSASPSNTPRFSTRLVGRRQPYGRTVLAYVSIRSSMASCSCFFLLFIIWLRCTLCDGATFSRAAKMASKSSLTSMVLSFSTCRCCGGTATTWVVMVAVTSGLSQGSAPKSVDNETRAKAEQAAPFDANQFSLKSWVVGPQVLLLSGTAMYHKAIQHSRECAPLPGAYDPCDTMMRLASLRVSAQCARPMVPLAAAHTSALDARCLPRPPVSVSVSYSLPRVGCVDAAPVRFTPQRPWVWPHCKRVLAFVFCFNLTAH